MTRRQRTRTAIVCLMAVGMAVLVVMSIGLWMTRTSAARLADDGVYAGGTPTGEVCSFEVRKYKGSYTQYAAMYAYTVNGHRYEVRGAAHYGEPSDVPTDATGVKVRYLPADPTEAIAHDEHVARVSNDSRTTPELTTDCSK